MASLTVAICTHNRAADVDICLDALAPQAHAANIPVLVVDSGSSEGEAVALERAAARRQARYIRVDAPGLSLARNVAYRESRSDWIVYVDDDAIPAGDWIPMLQQALDAVGDDIAIVGGKITPKWPDGADTGRMTERWLLLLSCTERSGRGFVSDGYNICGANFAIRISALERIGGFPEALGRVRGKLISGEEAYVIERLDALHLHARYDDRFVVQHRISAERLTLHWVSRRSYWEGVSRVRILQTLEKAIPADMAPLKLAASLPVLLLLKAITRKADYTVRYNMALGALFSQIGWA